MKKFTKGVLIAAGCFLTVGVVLGSIGAVGGFYAGEPVWVDGEFRMMNTIWTRLRKWDLRRVKGDSRGLVLVYDDVEFDDDYETIYGSFTDDALESAGIYRLEIEMGGGELILDTGDSMRLQKEGGPECQYYAEGGTFYLKQRCPVGGGTSTLRLTLPENMNLDEVEISMGTGRVVGNGLLAAKKVEASADAGEIVMEEVQTDYFSAVVGAGSVTVVKLDARDCEMNANMGSVCVQDGLVSGDLTAEVSMGDIQIAMRDSYENHEYDVSCSMGEIAIAEDDRVVQRYDGLGRSAEFSGRYALGNSVYELNCSMGSIYLEFEGRSADDETARMYGKTADENGAGEEAGNAAGNVDSLDAVEEELQDMGEELSFSGNIAGIEGSWPEGIGRENQNTTAENFSFEILLAEPATLVISCVTESGELDMVIEDENGREIFEEDEMRTGEYEVKARSAGAYRVCFEAENHTGSFWISQK